MSLSSVTLPIPCYVAYTKSSLFLNIVIITADEYLMNVFIKCVWFN